MGASVRQFYLVKRLLVCLMIALPVCLAGDSASDLYHEGLKAERSGQIARAYIFYSEAAAADPGNPKYWQRSLALRTQAAIEAKVMPPGAKAPAAADDVDPDEYLGDITEAELADARRPQPPRELKAAPGTKSFDLKTDSKQLWEAVAKAFGLEVVFDGDYQASSPMRFRIQDVGYRAALHALEAATGSFVIPIADRVFMVAKDNQQKRTELEPTVAVVMEIPQPFAVQDMQEVARSVQQTMEMPKFVIDNRRRMVVFRDRLSKARAAQALFAQLLYSRPQVAVDLDLMDFSRSSAIDWGLRLPTNFPLVNFGNPFRSVSAIPAGFARFAVFGGGKTFLGLGLTDAEMFATMSKSQAQTLLSAEIRSLDGEAGSLHVGDKYPILSVGYFGAANVTAGQQVFTPPPTFNFEDLGLVVKVTPHVHGMDEMSLDIEAEFKVLTGDSLDGIPVIANRKFQSKVRLKEGQWAVLAGLLSSTEARTVTGIPGLSSLPVIGRLMRQNSKSLENRDVLIVFKPRLLSLPSTEIVTREIYIGSESRPLTQL